MRSSAKSADARASIMLDVVAKAVSQVTGVTVEQLRSQDCTHKVTKARFIFSDLCRGVVSPASMVGDYLSKNSSMIAYYKRAHSDYYEIYKDFRDMSDKADELLTELLTSINGTVGNVFQEEE